MVLSTCPIVLYSSLLFSVLLFMASFETMIVDYHVSDVIGK